MRHRRCQPPIPILCNSTGVTITELAITVLLSTVLILVMLSTMKMSTDMNSSLMANVEFDQLTLDLRYSLQKNSQLCKNAFRVSESQNVALTLPATPQAITQGFNYLYLNEAPILAKQGSATPSGYRPYSTRFVATALELRIRDAVPTKLSATIDGTLKSLEAYHTELFIEAAKNQGGAPMERRVPFLLFVERSGGTIVNCSFTQTPVLQRAVAKRKAFTLDGWGKSCTYAFNPATDFQALDDDTGLIVPHPAITDPVFGPLWPIHMSPGGSSAPGPVSYFTNPTASYRTPGRCWTEVVEIPDGEDPNDIFVLHNAFDPNTTGLTHGLNIGSGIGCRTDKGWQLATCTQSVDGWGNADTYLEVHPNGDTVCASDTIWQAHDYIVSTYRKRWTKLLVELSVICVRAQQ